MQALVHAARLRYFARFARGAPAALTALVQATPRRYNRWLQEVVVALRWMRDNCSSVAELPDPNSNLRPWEAIARDWPNAWKAWVRRALSDDASRERLVAEGRRAEEGVIQLTFGAFEGPHGSLPCPECGQTFDSKQKL